MSEGSVFQRKDGKWCGKWKDASGKWRYLYRKTKGEAKTALREALKDRDDNIIPANRMTVGVLLDQWLEEMRGEVSERTHVDRESIVRIHLKPYIGDKRLTKLTPEVVRKLYRDKLAHGMARSSVRRLHAVLNQALRGAVRSKYIRSNPLDELKPPKHAHKEMRVLTPDQLRGLLDVVRGSRYEGIIVLGACCGVRIGEALSIRYEDVDLVAGTISIRRTLWKGDIYPPKTPQSRRTLQLPAVALEALTRHCEGDGNPTEGFMFVTRNGTPIAPENFWKWGWKAALRKAELDEGLHFHDLRHGAASLLLNQSVPVPVVSKYLGHANPGVTMKTYAHVIDGTSGMAAHGIDAALS